ncbi:molybdopterin oxidoreductase family protein [Actinopolymorpha pittospori]|uniref:Assimilatory nitrate reductase catalytic subunit n=2 Tax=Actinopolymorpha pittospori TaxID=648752 RepID=A0A927N821_9ACTN|nr:assimilatory nitrate reductase catalytic subunit [Actinopolymorpha pittospori]
MKPWDRTLVDMPGVATHCPYCALQCGMELRPAPATARPDQVEVAPRAAGGRRAALCQKGWTAAELLSSPERLRTPLVRRGRGAALRPATWDEALGVVATGIARAQEESGPGAVAVLGGGGLTNEKAYALGKFARTVLRTPNIDYNGRFCMSSAAAAGNRAFGLDRGLPFPMADIAEADTVLLVGSNVAETMPPFLRFLTAERPGDGGLIVVDPRRTETAARARLHLQLTPGTDLALALGLLHIAIVEGYVDREYVESRTTGFADVRPIVMTYWPERVERLTGVPVADQHEAVRLLAHAGRAMVLTARGAEQHAKGVDTVSAFVNLALALGLPGTPGSGYGCLTGQGNGQGGREHGQKSDQLPGYRSIEDPAARAHVASVWGVDPDSIPGRGPSATELLDALGRPEGPRALLVFGTNPVVSAPAAGRVEERLASLDLLVVADLVLSETAALADVVLPSAQWAEEDGTMTNLEGRVIRRRRLRPPPAQVRTDLEILAGLARALGHDAAIDTDPERVFDELGRASAGGVADYAGISYDRIDTEDGLFWPCPDADHPGTPRMFLDGFATPDRRARFVPVDHRPAVEDIDAAYPVYLTTGRVRAQYQSGAQTRRVPTLAAAAPRAFVELHPALAERHGIEDGDDVRVVSRRGSAVAPARLTDSIRVDTVFMPFHWPGAGRANTLTNPALDPTSRMPEFKVCAVRLELVA